MDAETWTSWRLPPKSLGLYGILSVPSTEYSQEKKVHCNMYVNYFDHFAELRMG